MSGAELAGSAADPAGGNLVGDVRAIILEARGGAVRSVDAHRVAMYWRIGQRIIEEEQGGEDRAEYGARLLDELAARIEPEFGSGFSARQLRYARQFYRVYPIWSAVRSKLNWYQHRTLMAIDNADKREFYELEAVRNGWTGRELERQVNSALFERLLKSSDKESVLAVARGDRHPARPEEIVKDPMVLEFLGLKPDASYYERDLESALPEDNRTILASRYQLYLPSETELLAEVQREIRYRSAAQDTDPS
jgi:hypothetical protein